jgi:hypothetical protein
MRKIVSRIVRTFSESGPQTTNACISEMDCGGRASHNLLVRQILPHRDSAIGQRLPHPALLRELRPGVRGSARFGGNDEISLLLEQFNRLPVFEKTHSRQMPIAWQYRSPVHCVRRTRHGKMIAEFHPQYGLPITICQALGA